jgi:HTH-type transcriptional regulator, glycine betaine synthesis regulator
MSSEPTSNDSLLRVADAIGELMEFWGFKRNMGRMWALLYLEPEPLSAAQLAERLSLSSGAVSMLLAELSMWGAVKKAWVPGERRDYYEPETSIWKMVSRVFRERELRKISSAIEIFEQATTALRGHLTAAGDGDKPRLELALDRIRSLMTLAKIGERLLEGMLSGKAIDASPIKLFSDRENEERPDEQED